MLAPVPSHWSPRYCAVRRNRCSQLPWAASRELSRAEQHSAGKAAALPSAICRARTALSSSGQPEDTLPQRTSARTRPCRGASFASSVSAPAAMTTKPSWSMRSKRPISARPHRKSRAPHGGRVPALSGSRSGCQAGSDLRHVIEARGLLCYPTRQGRRNGCICSGIPRRRHRGRRCHLRCTAACAWSG